MHSDTATAAHLAQLAVYRRMTGSERVALGMQMTEEARSLLADGVRARHPSYSGHDVEMAVRRILLGDDLTLRAWPHEPLRDP